MSGPLEQTELTVGLVALNDCAPIVVAKEKGWFVRHGLEVTVARQGSWASIRDRLMLGALDAAQMLPAMPLALNLGLEPLSRPTLTAFCLGLGGNAITVSRPLHQRMVEAMPAAMAGHPTSAQALAAVIAADRAAGRPPLTFAMVYPFSDHNYALRNWLAAAAIDPDADLVLTVVPPVQMVPALAEGAIDGYCVGEPWNSRAVRAGIGCTVVATCELPGGHPGKVLGVTAAWAAAHPNSHAALIRALAEAAVWLDRPENRLEAARLIADAAYVDAPFEEVAAALTGRYQDQPGQPPRHLPDFHVFSREGANQPRPDHARWLLDQMVRWGQAGPMPAATLDAAVAEACRPDLYHAAVAGLALGDAARGTG